MAKPMIVINGKHGPIRVQLQQPGGEWVDITHLVERVEIIPDGMIFNGIAWSVPINPPKSNTVTDWVTGTEWATPPEWGP